MPSPKQKAEQARARYADRYGRLFPGRKYAVDDLADVWACHREEARRTVLALVSANLLKPIGYRASPLTGAPVAMYKPC